MATAVTTETYLSPAEIARELNLHPSAPVRWCNRGAVLSDQTRIHLKHIRLPGGVRIKREDLDAFIAALTADSRQDTTSRQAQRRTGGCRILIPPPRIKTAGGARFPHGRGCWIYP